MEYRQSRPRQPLSPKPRFAASPTQPWQHPPNAAGLTQVAVPVSSDAVKRAQSPCRVATCSWPTPRLGWMWESGSLQSSSLLAILRREREKGRRPSCRTPFAPSRRRRSVTGFPLSSKTLHRAGGLLDHRARPLSLACHFPWLAPVVPSCHPYRKLLRALAVCVSEPLEARRARFLSRRLLVSTTSVALSRSLTRLVNYRGWDGSHIVGPPVDRLSP